MFDGSDEQSPHEPDEFDPDSLGPGGFDTDSLGPEVPSAPDPPESDDADPAVRGLFWWLVLLANVALLAASLGVMFVAFQGWWALGTQFTLAGAILGLYVYYRVKRFQSD
ncbi:DUF7322 domain-containing protein [Halapricum desulfuricans]|nr:hypothetical protein [Halapricum desulfuricans]